MMDLKTAAETAGDLGQMMVKVEMVGTVFGVAPPNVPMPSTIKLANDGFVCGKPTGQGNLLPFIGGYMRNDICNHNFMQHLDIYVNS